MTNYRDFYRELRADWLQLRSSMVDGNTGLPSMSAILDAVRRRLEAGEAMGVLYVGPTGGGHVEESCGWQAYDLLVRMVAERLLEFGRDHLSAEDQVALTDVRGDEFVIFVGLEGSSRIGRLEELRQRLLEALHRPFAVRLDGDLEAKSIYIVSALPLEPLPTVRVERTVYQGLDRARDLCRRESERRLSGQRRELRRMLDTGDVVLRFQPIVELHRGLTHGFEALSSAPSKEFFENPETLFTFAEEIGAVVDLERLCRRQATQLGAPLLGADDQYGGGKLFINCSSHTFVDSDLAVDLVRGAVEAGLSPGQLVVEVTERAAITEWNIFRQALEDIRRAGLSVAIDDMGSGYSSLHTVAEIQPEYLKFDASLVRDVHRSPIKRDMLETLVTLADKIGAISLAEGIETREELDTIRKMGVSYGQGFFFARPEEADEVGPVFFPTELVGTDL
jgi:EAL domain-containing protein (putative c-di-GMP-specific phosphodiesterase class I)/GGDEF domain-containing protein